LSICSFVVHLLFIFPPIGHFVRIDVVYIPISTLIRLNPISPNSANYPLPLLGLANWQQWNRLNKLGGKDNGKNDGENICAFLCHQNECIIFFTIFMQWLCICILFILLYFLFFFKFNINGKGKLKKMFFGIIFLFF
jgi:hypothetical protein